MLRDVKTTITDGGLGVNSPAGDGVHVKIGASAVVSAVPIIITGSMTASKIKELLGLSPLADAVMDSVESGAGRIYCIPVTPSVAGTVGAVSKTATGGGAATATGTPLNAYDIVVRFSKTGTLNVATLQISVDGGYSYGDEVTLPLTGILLIPSTGITLTFTAAATNPTNSFVAGDVYKVSSVAPQLNNQDVLTALGKLRNLSYSFEFVHVVGESAKATWAAAAAELTTLREVYKKPLFMVFEGPRPLAAETVDTYAARLVTEAKGFANYDIQVVAARSRYTRMDGRTMDINNAGIVCGWYARASVQQSIGEVKTFWVNEGKMLSLLPAGIEDVLDLLDEARYLTFRQYEGLAGYFVTNARMLAPVGSDYRYAEDVRVKNKLIRSTRKEALLHLQSGVDMSDVQGSLETIAKFIETPIDTMVRAKEISSGRIVVPEGQDILATETLSVIIRFVPVGKLREIDINLGMENPFKGA